MKILVTGGAGFIGSNLCETLVKRIISDITEDRLYRKQRRIVRNEKGKYFINY